MSTTIASIKIKAKRIFLVNFILKEKKLLSYFVLSLRMDISRCSVAQSAQRVFCFLFIRFFIYVFRRRVNKSNFEYKNGWQPKRNFLINRKRNDIVCECACVSDNVRV